MGDDEIQHTLAHIIYHQVEESLRRGRANGTLRDRNTRNGRIVGFFSRRVDFISISVFFPLQSDRTKYYYILVAFALRIYRQENYGGVYTHECNIIIIVIIMIKHLRHEYALLHRFRLFFFFYIVFLRIEKTSIRIYTTTVSRSTLLNFK